MRERQKREKPIEDESFIGCKLIADFMECQVTKDVLGNYAVWVIGDEDDAFDFKNRCYYCPDTNLEYLYPVYRKIVKIIDNYEFFNLYPNQLIKSMSLIQLIPFLLSLQNLLSYILSFF